MLAKGSGMPYARKRDLPRVCGLALEEADKAGVTGSPLPSFVTLDHEFTVGAAEEPFLPRILEWAAVAKAHIGCELADHDLAVLRGPLPKAGTGDGGFRGPGPRPTAGTPHGGVQATGTGKESARTDETGQPRR
jgi:hypothetical protein